MEEIQLAVTKVAEGSTYLILNYIITSALGYLSLVIVAKMVPPKEVGLATIATAVSYTLLIFATLGIPMAATKYLAECNAKRELATSRLIYKESLKIILFCSLLIALSLVITSNYLSINIYNNPALFPLLIIIAIAIPFNAIRNLLNGSYQGCQRMELCTLNDSIFSIVKLIAVVLLLILGLGALGITLSLTFGAIISALIGLFIFIPKALPTTKISREGDPPPARIIDGKLLLFSLPNFARDALGTISAQSALLLLGIYIGMAQVAYYNIAVMTIGVILEILGSISIALLPTISEEWSLGQKETLTKLYNLSIRLPLTLLGPILIVLIAFSENILTLISPPYAEAATVFRVLTILAFLSGIIWPSLTLLNGAGKPNLVLLIGAIAAAVDITLSILLIPKMGMIGAATAAIIAATISASLATVLIKAKLNIQLLLPELLKPIVCITTSLTILCISIATLQNILTAAIISIATYLIMINLLNAISKDEKTLLMKLAKNLRNYGKSS